MNVDQVTIFGGTGFVGRQIVRQLSGGNMRIRIAVRHPRNQSPAPSDVKTTQVYSDVRDLSSVAQAIEGSQAVINAVSLYVERGDSTFDAVHVRGAQNVAQEAGRGGVERLVYLSGLGTDPNSRSSYVRARTLGESAVKTAFKDATILRPSVIFGPGDSFLTSLKRITQFTPIFPLFGGGETLLQPVFVEDVAAAAAHAVSEQSAPGQIYELGGPQVYSYKTIVKLLLRHLDRKRLLIPIPFAIWEIEAACLSLLREPPLTRDQVILMEHDNVVSRGSLTLANLGIEPTALESQLASCLGDKSY